MSCCVSANTTPITTDAIAMAHSTPRHSQEDTVKATCSTRRIAPNAATFVHAAMKPVTAVGAPWYTSGVQVWNGPTEALNNNPISSRSEERRVGEAWRTRGAQPAEQ